MSTGIEMPLVEALARAEEFRDLFAAYVEEWHVCGSVRRCKPVVRDIDHVAVARVGDYPAVQGELFGGRGNLLLWAMDRALADGVVTKFVKSNGQTSWGEKRRAAVYRGVRHEVWVVERDNLGPALAIATGPAEFSQELVTQLRSRGQYVQLEGAVRGASDFRPRACVSEREYFGLCGMAWVEPAQRGVI